ncbi:MAG: UDP-N-acetylmuramyl-tripeptide synthetase [Myxococcales bacterium]|nr:UDP-N-acetylmuramyl-tripeptide synthetase [Myxococcales bacterium]MDD9967584.1 UDP-N-acetylmuramyl-tripeptide synthetase [Myxococcales bacterium]
MDHHPIKRALPQTELDALRAGLTTVAVTGTNGKTTTTSMVAAIAAAAGELPVRVTTLGMWVGDEQTADDGSMASFVRTVKRARVLGARTLALEVTSRALAAGFAERWPADIAVFTNLSHDHLDRHGSPEAYLAAKAQLFAGPRPPRQAILNTGDAASALIAEVMPAHVQGRGFSPVGAPEQASLPVTLASRAATPAGFGTRVSLAPSPLADALQGELTLAIAGDFNADNALAAAVAAHAAGLDPRAIAAGLRTFEGVPGRFEVLCRSPMCVVDFAHSPDALARSLAAARNLVAARDGRVACVFGCGGERDVHKRPHMGRVADRLADAVWITTDNPRSEAPAAIAAMVLAGIGGQPLGQASWSDVPDRAQAIRDAVAWARPQDAVVVAGRGHEAFQQLESGPRPLSDRQLVLTAVRR